MSLRFYYKTTDSSVVSAVKKHFDDREIVQREGVKFARRFGNKDAVGAMFSSVEYRLVGLHFKLGVKRDDDHLWTKRDAHGMRRPKPGGGEEGAALRAKWKKHWPAVKAPREDWLATVGEHWSPMNSLGYALRGRTVYIISGKPMKSKKLVEIVASEYVKKAGEKA